MGVWIAQREAAAAQFAAMPNDAPRVIVATGSYIGEGFADPRLDTIFVEGEQQAEDAVL